MLGPPVWLPAGKHVLRGHLESGRHPPTSSGLPPHSLPHLVSLMFLPVVTPVISHPRAFPQAVPRCLGHAHPSSSLGFGVASLLSFPISSVAKNPPAMQEVQEMCVQSLSWEDPLEVGVAAHSSILTWRIQWTEEPGGLQSVGSQKVVRD